jgi:hypothetical protein
MWLGIWPNRAERIRRAQMAPLVDPPGAISVTNSTNDIVATPAELYKHINTLWEYSHKDLALEVAQDARNSNVAIVRLVADLKLSKATSRAMFAAWVAGIAAVAAIVVGSIAIAEHTNSTPAPSSGTSQCNVFSHPALHNQPGGFQCFYIRHP